MCGKEVTTPGIFIALKIDNADDNRSGKVAHTITYRVVHLWRGKEFSRP
jgi:hypothetical protein